MVTEVLVSSKLSLPLMSDFLSPLVPSPPPSPSSGTPWPARCCGSPGCCAPVGSSHSVWGHDLSAVPRYQHPHLSLDSSAWRESWWTRNRQRPCDLSWPLGWNIEIDPTQELHQFLLLQHCPHVSNFFHFCLFGYLHLSTALNLAMFVGGDTSVESSVGLGHLSDLHFGILALVLDGDTTTWGDLPPFTLHPLHTGDRLTSDLGNEGCSAL